MIHIFKIQRQDPRNRLPVKSPRNLCELVAVKDAVELQGCAVACVHADNPTAHVGLAKDSSVRAYVDHGAGEEALAGEGHSVIGSVIESGDVADTGGCRVVLDGEWW